MIEVTAQVRGRTGYRSSLPSLCQVTKAPGLSNSRSVLKVYTPELQKPQKHTLSYNQSVEKWSQETAYKTNSNGKFSFLLKSSLMKLKKPVLENNNSSSNNNSNNNNNDNNYKRIKLWPGSGSLAPECTTLLPWRRLPGPALTAVPSLSGILGRAGEVTSQSCSSNSQLWCSPWGAQQAAVGQTGTLARAGKAIKSSLIACSLSPSHKANARTEDNPAKGETLDISFSRS